MLRIRRDERMYLRWRDVGHGMVVHRSRSEWPAISPIHFGMDRSGAHHWDWNFWSAGVDAMAEFF